MQLGGVTDNSAIRSWIEVHYRMITDLGLSFFVHETRSTRISRVSSISWVCVGPPSLARGARQRRFQGRPAQIQEIRAKRRQLIVMQL
eukprot:5623677-Pyramimonas_sp.AAC.1